MMISEPTIFLVSDFRSDLPTLFQVMPLTINTYVQDTERGVFFSTLSWTFAYDKADDFFIEESLNF